MIRRNKLVFIVIMMIFALAALVVFPIQKGILGKRGIRLGLDLQGGVHIVYQADLSGVKPGDEANAINGVIAVLENRVNPLGVTEPLIQRQGNDRVVVELPGKEITDKEKESLARVALLEFGELTTDNASTKWENELGKWKPATGVINGEERELTSRYFKENTFVRPPDNLGRIMLVFEWDDEGSKLSEQITTRLVDQPLGIFEGNEALLGEDGRPIAPIVQEPITTSGVIRGLSLNEATRLSKQLNAGRLPVPLEKIYDQTISPILGSDFVEKSVKSGIIGIIIVMLFMIIYYRLPGLLASVALAFYALLVIALFKLIPVTLTLAGMGGFIVSIGMAVDANVLIFERMKEEIIAGRTFGAAIENGFSRAWTAIWDSNFTTFIACGVLYWLGSSIAASAPVKGFALTLFIGVAVSMLTAVFVTRTLLRLFVGTALTQRLRLFSPHLGGK